MSAIDPQDLIQWEEALRWLAKADEDIASAELLLNDVPGQAGFHIQQALEKTLNALLIAKRQDIRKTHDIALLVALVRPYWPGLIKEPFALVFLTAWYLTSRYPEFDEVDPITAEVGEALADVKSFMANVYGVVPPEIHKSV